MNFVLNQFLSSMDDKVKFTLSQERGIKEIFLDLEDKVYKSGGDKFLWFQVCLHCLQNHLIVDPSTKKVIPNPRSPEMRMVEILMTTSPNTVYAVRFAHTNCASGTTSHRPKTLGESFKNMKWIKGL